MLHRARAARGAHSVRGPGHAAEQRVRRRRERHPARPARSSAAADRAQAAAEAPGLVRSQPAQDCLPPVRRAPRHLHGRRLGHRQRPRCLADRRRRGDRAASSRVRVPLTRPAPAALGSGQVPGSAVRRQAGRAAARAGAVHAAERGDRRAAAPARPRAGPAAPPAPFAAHHGRLNVRLAGRGSAAHAAPGREPR